MSALAERLRKRIEAEGPITVEAWMAACNEHYYATRDPIGRAGDFTTAPEISQMFGEMVGACLADCWLRAGSPEGAIYAELGPGRGTLAADALRVLGRSGFEGEAHLVETSPSLREKQAENVPGASWHDRIASLPAAPLLLVANEFLDALPVRQFAGGEERRVRAEGESFQFSGGGEVTEDSPARAAAMRAIAAHLVRHGGVALVIDYGHLRSAPGDTLQAVKNHRFTAVLDNPGEQDLTAHVDFEAAAQAAAHAGAMVSGPVEQGPWLKVIGIEARAAALAGAHPDRRLEVEEQLARLCSPEQMGSLFKLLAIRAPGWPVPAGFEA